MKAPINQYYQIKHHKFTIALNYTQLTAENTLSPASMIPGPNLSKARLGLMFSCGGRIPLMMVTIFSIANVK